MYMYVGTVVTEDGNIKEVIPFLYEAEAQQWLDNRLDKGQNAEVTYAEVIEPCFLDSSFVHYVPVGGKRVSTKELHEIVGDLSELAQVEVQHAFDIMTEDTLARHLIDALMDIANSAINEAVTLARSMDRARDIVEGIRYVYRASVNSQFRRSRSKIDDIVMSSRSKLDSFDYVQRAIEWTRDSKKTEK